MIYLLLLLLQLAILPLLLLLLQLFHDTMHRRQQSPRLSLPNTTTKNWKSARALSERRRRASDIDAVASVIRDTNHSSQSPPLPLIFSSHEPHDDIDTSIGSDSRREMSSNRRRRLSITTDEALEIYDVAIDDSILYDINEINNINNNSETTVFHTSEKQEMINEMSSYVSSDDECVVYDDNDLWESTNDFIYDNVDDDNNDYNSVREEVEVDNSSQETEEIERSSSSTVVSYLHRLSSRVSSIREKNRMEYEEKNVVGDEKWTISSPPYMKKLSFSELGELKRYFIVI